MISAPNFCACVNARPVRSRPEIPMVDKSVNQMPIVDESGKYVGMIFAKQLINSTAQPISKLKSYITNTPTLRPETDIEKAAELVIGSGNRALPVVENGRLLGIVSETDLVMPGSIAIS